MATSRDGAAPVVDALVQATFRIMSVLSAVAADNDLSLTQLRVLAILRDRRVRMSELAGYLGLDRSTMSGLVERAVTRGLLVRVPGAHDGRVVEVTVSAAGAALADTVRERVSAQLLPETSRLTAAEGRQLGALLAKIPGGVEAATES